MAFKLDNPPFHMDNTPIYRVDMEDSVMGKANNNGSITINKDLHPDEVENVSKGLNIPCGCQGRKEALNKMLPYRK